MREFRVRRPALRLLAACMLCLGAPAGADLIVTAAGESLSGDLTRIVDGILVFRTSLQGQMMLPMTEVKSISTDETWVISEQGGDVHVGRFVVGGIAGGNDGKGAVAAIDLSAIASAKPVPGQPESARDGRPDAGASWSAAAGVRAFDGTEDGMAPLLSLDAQGDGRLARARLQLRFDPSGGDFPSYFTGAMDVTSTAVEGWGPFAEATVDRNTNEALRARTGLTLGTRYAAAMGETGRFEALAGIGGTHAEWYRGYLDGTRRAWRGNETDETVLNLLLGLRYSRELWGNAYWSGEVRLQPGVAGADDFRAGASSSLVYPVTGRLQLRFDMLLNYDRDPVFEELDTVDTSVGASIQLDF